MKNIHKKLLFHDYLGGIPIRGVILAAGEGTRFGDLTKRVPKALLPCLGRTLIEQLVDRLLEAGISSISIGVGWKGAEVSDLIESHYSKKQVNCIDVPSYQTGPLQTLVTTVGDSDDTLLVCPVDLFIEASSISGLLALSQTSDPFDLMMAIDRTSHQGYPLMVDDGLTITRLGSGNARSAMMLLVSANYLKFCRIALSKGDTRLIHVIEQMINSGARVIAGDISGYWADIDTKDDLLSANTTLLKKFIPSSDMLFIPDGDEYHVGEPLTTSAGIHIGSGVTLRGPVLFTTGIQIGDNCTIGPNVCIQGQSSVAQQCVISNSLVFGASSIHSGTSISRMIVYDSYSYMV